MKQLQVLAWFWLMLGVVGSVYKVWHAVTLGGFIYYNSSPAGLAWEIAECVFAIAGAASGYGLVRRWRWSRFAIELLASILLGVSATFGMFSDASTAARATIYLPPAIFSLYSLITVLFFRFEPREA